MKMAAAAIIVIAVVASVVSLEIQRRNTRLQPGFMSGWAVTITAAFSLTILQGYHLIGDSVSRRVLLLAPFVLCIAYCRLRTTTRVRPVPGLLLGAFVAVVAVTLWRGAQAEHHGTKNAMILAVTLAVVALFAITINAGAQDADERRRRMLALACAPGIYVVVNVLLHLAGFVSTSTTSVIGEPSEFGALLHITPTRLVPPLGDNVNSFGAMTGTAIAATLVLWRTRAIPGWAVAITLACCTYAMGMTDSRNALVSGVLVGLLLRPALRFARYTPLVLPISPLVVLYVPGWLGKFISGLARSSSDLTTGNSRLFIWRPTWTFIQHAPFSDTLVGWGAHGQRISGASAHYAYIFRAATTDPTAITTHNLFFQTVLDMGWAGLVLLMATAITALTTLRADHRTPGTAVAAIIVVLTLAGMTEAVPTYNFPETLLLLMLALGTAVVPAASEVAVPKRVPAWQRQAQRRYGYTTA